MAAGTGRATYRSAVNPWIAIGVTLGVIVLAGALGLIWKATTGRARTAREGTAYTAGDLPGLDLLGDYATLVQFSTEYCATCPATRRLLGETAAARTGVNYLDVDLTHNGELAKRLHILQTPTVFVLDRGGRLVSRFGGAPRRGDLAGLLDTLIPTPEWNI